MADRSMSVLPVVCSVFVTAHSAVAFLGKYRSYSQIYIITVMSQQTRYIYPMFDQCWANVIDGGPTLVKHQVDVSCLLG